MLALGPGVAEAERGHDPDSHSEVVEVVEVRPDTALTVAPLHHCEDVHQEEKEQADPAEDHIVQPVVEGRED